MRMVGIILLALSAMQQASIRIITVHLWSGGVNPGEESIVRNLVAWLLLLLYPQSHQSRGRRFLAQGERVHGVGYASHAKLSGRLGVRATGCVNDSYGHSVRMV